MRGLVIIGASGHGKVVADVALRVGYDDVRFLDDDIGISECAGFPVVGRVADVECMPANMDFFVAVGNSFVRRRITEELEGLGCTAVTLVHPSACISRRVEFGAGTVVMAGVVINSDVRIGSGCIINTGATVDHDCTIGDFVHVSVGAHIAGTVEVGSGAWIGAGAVVSNNVDICADVLVGAGAVVVHDICEPGTYVGVPARLIDH